MHAGSSNHSRDSYIELNIYFKIVFLNIYNSAYIRPLFANPVTNKDQVQVKRNEAIATGVHSYS